MPQSKLETLRELLRSFGSCLTAYSGGVDSVFLAYVAHQALRARGHWPPLPIRPVFPARNWPRHSTWDASMAFR